MVGGGGRGVGAQENRAQEGGERVRGGKQEAGEERKGSGRSKIKGIIYYTLKYFHKQEPKMLFY